jgi:PAS domain S-box-containing protein
MALDFICESPIGFAVISNTGHFLWLNQAYCDILNAHREQVLGTSFHKWTHNEDIKLDSELSNKVMKGEIRQYRMVKRYKQLGHTEAVPRIVVGALVVFGNFDSDGNFLNYRVTFDAYVPDQSQNLLTIDYEKWITVLVSYLWNHRKTVVAVILTLAGLTLGNSEKLFQTLRVIQRLNNELEQPASGSLPLP